jgi:hypothetical protein
MSNSEQVWWRPGGRSPFALDPAEPRLPQIVSAIGQSLIIFGGPLIGLLAINHYPFLIMDRTIYIGGLASIVFWFLASFAIYGDKDFPRGMPQFLKLQFRAGYGLCMTFLLLGVFGIANGYGVPTISRDVRSSPSTPRATAIQPVARIMSRCVRGPRRAQSWSLVRRVTYTIVCAFHAPQSTRRRMSSMRWRIAAPCGFSSVKAGSAWNG